MVVAQVNTILRKYLLAGSPSINIFSAFAGINIMVSEIGRTLAWLPVDGNQKLDASMNFFSLVLDLVKSIKFDKDYNSIDYYFVSLKIDK